MTFEIDGVNLLPYLAEKGLKWSREDLDGPDVGRTLDGVMHRMRVATKIRLDIVCRPLTDSEASTVLSALMPEYVTVKYNDPLAGGVVEKTMYANNNPATFLQMRGDVGLWDDITFPLVEQ